MEGIEENVINSKTIAMNGYTFWSRAEIVYPYIRKYLKEKFFNSLIIPEFNRIDLVIIDELLPIEIQSTQLDKRRNGYAITHCSFEDRIRRQIEDNIENYEKCWFFFDAEYYRYLNEAAGGTLSLNLDWFAKYVKEGKLKVFIVRYDGEIKELKYEDLGFIRKLSNTCKVEYEDDERVLNRNKLKIFCNVLKGYKFTQVEIDEYIQDYNKREKDKDSLSMFLIKSSDSRRKLYGYILQTLGSLIRVNTFLDGNTDGCGHGAEKVESIYLGIFDKDEHNHVKFVDKFNICQYFPSYQRNKEIWNRFKDRGGSFNNSQLREVYKLYKNNEKTLLDY